MIYPDIVQAWVDNAIILDANNSHRVAWAARQAPGDIHRLVHDWLDDTGRGTPKEIDFAIVHDLVASNNVDQATLLDIYVRRLDENMHAPADAQWSTTSVWRETINLMHQRLKRKEYLKLGFHTYGFNSKYGYNHKDLVQKSLLRQKELRKKRIGVAFKVSRQQAGYEGTHLPERRYVLHRGVIRHSFPLWAKQNGYPYEQYLF